MSGPRRWSSADVVLFCGLLGVVTTFASGYTYGEFNQVEHLPMIFRAMDADYLQRDFFVNAVDRFNPRFYYVWLMASAGAWIPLPLLFAVLTCLANAAIAGVTWHIGRCMSDDSPLAPALACCMVLAVNAFNEGGAAQIPRDFLGPSLLARPLAMLALWQTISGAAWKPALLFVAATVLHPLVGAETAAIALGAAGLARLSRLMISSRAPAGNDDSSLFSALGRLAAIGVVVGVAGWALYGGVQSRTLTTDRFIQILAEARGPHHYIPSRFGTGSHLAFAVFCAAATLAWIHWRRRAPRADVARALLAVGIVVLIACVGGYVFVELWPTRLWTSAQPFRMTYLIKWFGVLLFGYVGARAIRPGRPIAERLSGSLLVLGVGRYQPAIALTGNLGIVLGRRLGTARATVANVIVAGFALLAVLLVAVPVTSRPEEPLVLALLLAIAACFLLVDSPALRRAVPTLVVGAAVLTLVGFRSSPTLIDAARTVGIVAPRMSLAESNKGWSEAARFARAETPEDSVFVVPPRLGGFRLIAGRAVVVDNKVFPFGDAAMAEWYQRMLFTHAGRLDGDLPNLMVLDDNFAAIDDRHLLRVQRRYGATHALLLPDTPTRMPVLYEDEVFKIVRIDDR